ncbi:MAG: RDD family protein [Betaproteobacteria bacterium]|nr:RDD family protein [Betaproteobacteria bacterium]
MPASDTARVPGIPRRLAGMFYETLLLLGVLALLLVLPHILLGAFAHLTATPATLRVHLFLVLLVYFVWLWSNGGQTLAMKTWRVRVQTKDGLPVRPAQALLRFLLCWPSIGLGGAGILWAIFDRDGQFLHDRIAGTRLVMA